MVKWGRNKKSRRGGMLVQLIFRQGSGVPPDSGKTVLRSGLVLKLKHQETAGQTASAEKLSPAEPVEVHISTHGGHMGYLGLDDAGGIRWAETQVVDWLTKTVMHSSRCA